MNENMRTPVTSKSMAQIDIDFEKMSDTETAVFMENCQKKIEKVKINKKKQTQKIKEEYAKLKFKDIIEKGVYKTVPTWQQAAHDFSHILCEDLLNLNDSENEEVVMIDENFDTTIVEENHNEEPAHKKHKGKSEAGNVKTSNNQCNVKPNGEPKVDIFDKAGMKIVKGHCQSGKEKFTISAAIKTISRGRVPIIITRRLDGDADKFQRGIEHYTNIFNQFIVKHKVICGFNISSTRVSKLTDKKIQDSIKGVSPTIVVSLGNNTQLQKIYEIVNKYPGKFDLLIDEIDSVDYGSDKNGKKTLAAQELEKLKQISYQTIGITATPLDSMLNELDAQLVRLSRPYLYRGMWDIGIRTLHSPTNGIPEKATTYEDIIANDLNLEPFLEYFKTSILDHSVADDKLLPNICLMKMTNFVEKQKILFNGITKRYNFPVIMYNGDGVRIWYKDMPNSIFYNGKLIKPNFDIDMDITEALQFLKDNGDRQKFPRILIISGYLAGRCTSYVSRDYVWHLTDMYYVPSPNTTVPELCQSVGRLCGLNKGKSHLYLWATLKVIRSVYNGFNFTDEIIDKADKLSKDTNTSLNVNIKKVPMLKDKLPIDRDMTNKVEFNKREFNLVDTQEEDGGMTLEEYKNYKSMFTPVFFLAAAEAAMKKAMKKNEDVSEIGEEEFKRLVKLFHKWSTAQSKIGCFMRELDPKKIYNEKEMKELCKNTGIANKSHLLRDPNSGDSEKTHSKGFGQLIRKNSNNTYQLYPCLVSSFEEYF